jgi:LmbE family N-acetylglucosaminyl deacetylase
MMDLAALFGGAASVLFVGAHADDIEIGCGATILRLRAELPEIAIHSLVMSSSPQRADEARAAATAFVGDDAKLSLHEFRDGHMPWSGGEVKEAFAEAVTSANPDVLLVHRDDDAHQDHRLLGSLAIQVARSALILHYEIPKYDGDLGRPNLYVGVPAGVADRKIELLHKAFVSQTAKDWFDEETLRGLLRLRGVESRHRYAEAYWAPKLVIT